LLNRYTVKSRIEGSNPSVSAITTLAHEFPPAVRGPRVHRSAIIIICLAIRRLEGAGVDKRP